MKRGDYEDKVTIAFIFYTFLFLFSGCCSSGEIRTDLAGIVAGNSRAIGKLEATITALDSTIDDSRQRIANVINTSRGIADGIDRVEYLFGEYEHEIERLLNEIDGIRSEIEVSCEVNRDCSGNVCGFCDSQNRIDNIEN